MGPPAALRHAPVPQRPRPSTEDTARRVLEALHRSAARARRVAAQTGTRIVVVRDGKLVIEPVELEPDGASEAEATPPSGRVTGP